MTKTFHIGEYALYGTIRVTQKDSMSNVELLDYKTKNVRERRSFEIIHKHRLLGYLEMVTTPYYADKIIKHFYN
jgi:hypothetical protein